MLQTRLGSSCICLLSSRIATVDEGTWASRWHRKSNRRQRSDRCGCSATTLCRIMADDDGAIVHHFGAPTMWHRFDQLTQKGSVKCSHVHPDSSHSELKQASLQRSS